MPPSTRQPWALRFRSSLWFVTAGITTDLLVYSSIIPVIPFQLEHLNYTNVSALTGWLLCAYVRTLLSTIPIAFYAEVWSSRQWPLLIGQLSLIGSQVLLMYAPNFAVMAIARIFQGISSSMVWVVGLALLCDTTPEHRVGKQLGIAMTGLSFGLLVGSPVGGALYSRFGYHAPFIFGIICAALDFLARLCIIERHDAIKWGVDPWGSTPPPKNDSVITLEATLQPPRPVLTSASLLTVTESRMEFQLNPFEFRPLAVAEVPRRWSLARRAHTSETTLIRKPASLLSVLISLIHSHRAVAALSLALVYGIVNSMQEPTLPLRLQAVWGYTSNQVGLVYLAAFIPALVSSPLAGWLSDRIGNDYITFICLISTIPWWILLTLRKSVILFIISLAMQSFFVGGVVPPVTSELASVSRNLPGVGYAHVYGAFNLAFGIGTAVGPVIGGQIYAHVNHGWTILCCITVGLIVFCGVLAFFCTGPTPLFVKFVVRRSSRTDDDMVAASKAKEMALERAPSPC
ncbi:major facilitator superfamily domain-containing protein [Scleroderma yunnanense]